MCGIIYLKRKDGKKANKSVLKRYHRQRSRGTDGFGYVTNGGDGKTHWLRVQKEKEIKDKLADSVASEILFHHRTPTSVPNLPEGAHPLKISHDMLEYDYYVAHNGIIRNDEERKKAHEKLGFVYQTEMQKQVITIGKTYSYEKMWNDSEAVAIDFVLAIEGKADKVLSKGASALVAWRIGKADKKLKGVFFARNEANPLKYADTKDFIVIGSETEGELIAPHKLFWLNEDGTLGEREMLIGKKQETRYWDTNALGFLGGYAGSGTKLSGLGYDAYENDDDVYDIVDDEDYQVLKDERNDVQKMMRRALVESNYEKEESLKAELNFLNYKMELYENEKRYNKL